MDCNLCEIAKDAIWSLLDPTILPYYGLNIIYGVTQAMPFIEEEYGLVPTVAFKTAPIWYLVFYVKVIKKRRLRDLSSTSLVVADNDGEGANGEASYNKNFTNGLVFSLIGDALLVFPATFFHGVFFFGAAHVFYILGLRKRYGRASYAWAVVPVCLITSPYILSGTESYSVAAVVIVYNVTINTMLFYAISSLESQCSASTLMATIGAFSFVVSDFIIAFDLWIRAVPYRSLIVMSAYYFSQVNLALSVIG